MRKPIHLLALGAILLTATLAPAQTTGESGAAPADGDLDKGAPRETAPPPPVVLPVLPPEQQAGPDAQALRNQAPPPGTLIGDEQRIKMGEIRKAFREESMPLFNDMRNATGELGRLLEAEKPEKAKVDAAIAKLMDLQRKILERRVTAAVSMWNLFTPEQKEALIKRGQSPLDMVPAGAFGDGLRREGGARTVRPAPPSQ